MSDAKKAALKLAKLEAQVDEAGLDMQDLGGQTHEISGVLDGTHKLTASHSMLNHTNVFDFTLSAGHDFNFTISGFQPQTWNGAGQPSWDGIHDLLEFRWDSSTGVTNLAQEHAAVHASPVVGADGHYHDYVLTLDAPHVHGTITFAGLADYFYSQPNAGTNWGWHDSFIDWHAV